MKVVRVVLVVVIFYASLFIAPGAQAQLTPQETIKKAFSLVGHWNLTKLEVSKIAFAASSPASVPSAAVGAVSIDLGSSLGEGFFEVDQNGTITGRGTALYRFRVSGGSNTAGVGTGGVTGLGIAVPVGAAAMLAAEDDGKRAFNISGQANLKDRTISLSTFQPSGGPLKVIIQPSSTIMTAPLWPPMTNVDAASVVVVGASLLLRAAGVVGGMHVEIEAVRYVDLERLFETIISSCGCSQPQSDTRAPSGPVSNEMLGFTLSKDPTVISAVCNGPRTNMKRGTTFGGRSG